MLAHCSLQLWLLATEKNTAGNIFTCCPLGLQQETSEKVTLLHIPNFILGGILRNQLTNCVLAAQNNETTLLSVGLFIINLFLNKYCQNFFPSHLKKFLVTEEGAVKPINKSLFCLLKNC